MLCSLRIGAVVLLLSAYVSAQGRQRFREDLFPEQLQQQELNVHTQVLQDQLQDLNVQWQKNPANGADFIKRRDDLLKELQNSQILQQELQRRLQLRLSNTPLNNFGLPPVKNSTKGNRQPQFPPGQQQFQQQPQFVQQPQQQFVQQPQQEFVQQPQQQFAQPQQQFIQQPQQQFVQPPFVPQGGGSFSQASSSSSSGADGTFSQSSAFSGAGNTIVLQPIFVVRRPRCVTASGEKGRCKPLSQCVKFYADVPELRRQTCPLNEVETGVCCPKKRNRQPPPLRPNQPSNGVLRAPPPPNVVIPPFTPQQLNNAGQVALQRLQERVQFIAQLFANNVILPDGTPAAWHQQFFQTTNETLNEGNIAQKTVEASVNLVNDFNLSPEQGRFALPAFSVLNTVIADTCPPRGNCQPLKYRTPDGSCNNLANERWGKAGTALQRILPPKYEDGVNAPRSKASNGQDLPSARLVSTLFATEANLPHENLTLFVMQWGQFLDHDLTHTPISKGQGGSGITCCKDGVVIEPRTRHPDCFAIGISRQDHMFAPFGERCMEFTRSLPAPRPECNFGPREQMNQITGHLDGSNVYGSSLDTQRALREFQGGRLKAQRAGRSSLLPDNKDECTNEIQQSCFRAGDTRVNEQVNLAVIHTLFLREHNKVVGELARLNPGWSDEALFQEGRRIVVAEMQHITYNEWLPIILGPDYMEKFELAPKEEGQTQLYDPNVNPSITNVFAAAAFRFGHSLVTGLMQGMNRFGQVKENLILHQHHFSPFVLYNQGSIDNFVRGLSTQSSQKADRHFTKELTDHLFQGDLDFGLDLVSLNIQRARDHGIPPYNDWREVCGLPKVQSWQELGQILDPESVNSLQRLYPSVDEVDLFPAAMAEKAAPGALLGPTWVCLVGDQFSRLRRGDRFFYEESGQPSSFTPEQMSQLKNANLARILCDNSDDLAVMQPLAFFKSSVVNQRLDCKSESILHVDLSPWRGEQPQA